MNYARYFCCEQLAVCKLTHQLRCSALRRVLRTEPRWREIVNFPGGTLRTQMVDVREAPKEILKGIIWETMRKLGNRWENMRKIRNVLEHWGYPRGNPLLRESIGNCVYLVRFLKQIQ